MEASGRRRGRPPREGLDFLDIGIMQVASRQVAEEGRWSATRIALACDTTKQTVSDRIARLRSMGAWGHGDEHGVNAARLTLDAEARRLIAENFGLVRTIARRVAGKTGDLDEIESAAQWALVRASTQHDSVRGDFAPFAAACMKRAAEKARYRPKAFDPDQEDEREAPPPPSEQLERLSDLLHGFGQREREFALLVFAYGFSGREAARTLGVAEREGSDLLKSIRRKVARRLEEEAA